MLAQACASIRHRLLFSLQRISKQNTMNIKDLLQDDALKALEDQIIMSFEGLWSKDHDYTDERSLIEVRKTIINHRVLQHQDLLLPDIIAFNDTMREALREMFDKAHAVYEANKKIDENVEIWACCYLSIDYSALHPVQGENRQELWNALQDSGWNLLYDTGVFFPLRLIGNYDPNSNDFDDFIGMNCPPPNWNEGLDQELTKDLHLIQAFHNLFDHTDFAITDFIFCRDFYYEIKVEFRNEIQRPT